MKANARSGISLFFQLFLWQTFFVADDDNRVKLSIINEREDSDFINASYIQVQTDRTDDT